MARRRVTRKWEVFAGRNRFWCDGRAMTAPQPGFLVLTLALIVGTCALHFAFDSPYLAARVSPGVPAAGAALAAFTLAALLRTALSDPGIIPRAGVAEVAALALAAHAASASPDPRPPPRALDVLVRGRPLKLKYCFTCKMFRPPRASHCSVCDNCVDRFDHHCPWVGNCVGRRNYRHFYTFVVSLSFLAVFVLGCAATHLALAARGAGLAAALRATPASALIAAVCFLAVWSVLGLAGFHTYLAATDQTTNEDIKGSWSSRRGTGGDNPYSRGNACANCWHVLCGPLAPSLIDRRGVVSSETQELPATVVPAVPTLSVPPPALPPAPAHGSPRREDGGGGGGDAGGASLHAHTRAHAHTHAYTNGSLELDAAPLQEVVVSGGVGGGVGGGGGGGGGGLSASRLRLLLDTTMIDAALDLDDPVPLPLPPAL